MKSKLIKDALGLIKQGKMTFQGLEKLPSGIRAEVADYVSGYAGERKDNNLIMASDASQSKKAETTDTKPKVRDEFEIKVQAIVDHCGGRVKEAVEYACKYAEKNGRDIPWKTIHKKLMKKDYTTRTDRSLVPPANGSCQV